MRSYGNNNNSDSKSLSKKNTQINDLGKKTNLALASRSANNFYNVSKSKIRNNYMEAANEKVDYNVKYHAKEFLVKTKSISKLENYDTLVLPPTANDEKLFSSTTSLNFKSFNSFNK